MKLARSQKAREKRPKTRKAKIKTNVFDASKYLKDAASQRAILEDAIDGSHTTYIAHELGIVAKAQGMAKVAKKVGVTREGLYKSLSKDGDPRLSTFLGVLKALGFKLKLERA
jgi:probable addiction module antidote protein